MPKLRRQDTKNRQNSIDDVDPFIRQQFEIAMQRYFEEGLDLYRTMLDKGIAKECARMVLPLASLHQNLHDRIMQIMDPLYRP